MLPTVESASKRSSSDASAPTRRSTLGRAINKTEQLLLPVNRFPQTRPPNHPTTGQRRVYQEINKRKEVRSHGIGTLASYQRPDAVRLIVGVAFWLRLWLLASYRAPHLPKWFTWIIYWLHYIQSEYFLGKSFPTTHQKILSMASQFGPNTQHETRETWRTRNIMHLVHASSLLRVREENWDQTHAEKGGLEAKIFGNW